MKGDQFIAPSFYGSTDAAGGAIYGSTKHGTKGTSVYGDGVLSINGQTGVATITGTISMTGDAAFDDVTVNDRLKQTKGSDVAGAGTFTVGDGNYFSVTGTTKIDHITTTGWQNGSTIKLIFAAGGGINHNTGAAPANTLPVLLASEQNFLAEAGDIITLTMDTAGWRESAAPARTRVLTGHVRYSAPIAAELISIVNDVAMGNGAQVIAAQPDYPRKLQVRITDADSSVSAGKVTIVGVDACGAALTEEVTLTGGTATKITNYAFATVTSATISLLAGNGAGDNIGIGVGKALGMPVEQRALNFACYKECRDNANDTIGTVDTAAKTVAPSHDADATHNYDFWYRYTVV